MGVGIETAEGRQRPRRVGDTVAIDGDYQYRALHEGPAVQRFWHDTKLWLVDRYLRLGPRDRVLDVGCGSGVVAAHVADQPLRDCIGVDGNPEAIAFASSRFSRPNLRFVRGLVDDLDFPDAHFDGAVCLELIEHIHPDQGRALLETLHRLVRPGGRLLLTTPNYRSAWPLLEWALDRSGRVPRLDGEQHVAHYNHARLRRLCRESGWITIQQHTCCTFAPWLAPLGRRLAETIRRAEAGLPCGTLLVHLVERPVGPSGSVQGGAGP